MIQKDPSKHDSWMFLKDIHRKDASGQGVFGRILLEKVKMGFYKVPEKYNG